MLTLDPGSLSHRERYFLLIGSIVPRPIAFVSTVSSRGKTNVAPFSYFNGVSSSPPLLSVAIGSRAGKPKDSWRNIEETGEFVVNVVPEEIFEKMVAASADFPPEISEFDETGLTPVPSERITPPRVAESPIQLECVLHELVKLGDSESPTALVIGEVVLAHVRDGLYLEQGHIDPEKLRAIGRMGRQDYVRTRDRFERKRPRT
ncbi:MAG: flavin reductase family protein [Gemmatimonadetes bacterium]|nr:flavin reductase family protein [Gemmatimonadota bacterium]